MCNLISKLFHIPNWHCDGFTFYDFSVWKRVAECWSPSEPLKVYNKNVHQRRIKLECIVNSALRLKVQFVLEEKIEVQKCETKLQGIDVGISSLTTFDYVLKIAVRKRKLETGR